MIFEFGDFAPDLSIMIKGKSPRARNVIPVNDGYIPLPSFISPGVAALPLRCLGAISAKDLDGVTRVYLATAAKIYEISGLSLSDKTRVAGDYALVGTDQWDFVVGKNQVIGTNITEPVQALTFGGANFAALITSTLKPKAKHITVANLDWLVLGNTTDTTYGNRPTRVQWSARGNFADFDPNINTRAGFRDLDQQYGEVVGFHTREFTTVFQEQSISRMTFEGGSTTFRFDLVEKNIGPIAGPGSIANFGPFSFYLSLNGFQMFNGTMSAPIGTDQVDKYVLDIIDYNNLAWVSSAIYPKYNLVIWAIPTPGSSIPRRLFIYNWSAKRWSEAEVDVERLFSSHTISVGVDDINYADLFIDDLPQSEWLIDDLAFAGGLGVLSAVDDSHLYKTCSGSPMVGDIQTNYITMENRSTIDTVIAMVEMAVNPVLYVYIRDDIGQNLESVHGPFTRNMFNEFVPCLQGRHFRFGLMLSDFQKVVGLNVNFFDSGVR